MGCTNTTPENDGNAFDHVGSYSGREDRNRRNDRFKKRTDERKNDKYKKDRRNKNQRKPHNREHSPNEEYLGSRKNGNRAGKSQKSHGKTHGKKKNERHQKEPKVISQTVDQYGNKVLIYENNSVAVERLDQATPWRAVDGGVGYDQVVNANGTVTMVANATMAGPRKAGGCGSCEQVVPIYSSQQFSQGARGIQPMQSNSAGRKTPCSQGQVYHIAPVKTDNSMGNQQARFAGENRQPSNAPHGQPARVQHRDDAPYQTVSGELFVSCPDGKIRVMDHGRETGQIEKQVIHQMGLSTIRWEDAGLPPFGTPGCGVTDGPGAIANQFPIVQNKEPLRVGVMAVNGPITITCGKGHKLKLTKKRKYKSFTCDTCNQGFDSGLSHHCKRCEFDICVKCVSQTQALSSTVPIGAPNMMPHNRVVTNQQALAMKQQGLTNQQALAMKQQALAMTAAPKPPPCGLIGQAPPSHRQANWL